MTNHDHALRIIVESHRELANKLEGLLAEPKTIQSQGTVEATHQAPSTLEGTTFDPEHDHPEVDPDPHGTRAQKDWAGLQLFGRIQAINQRKNRGATKTECIEIAQKAGYRDARAWAGWNPPTWQDDENNARWITEAGIGFLRDYYNQVNRTLPKDLA